MAGAVQGEGRGAAHRELDGQIPQLMVPDIHSTKYIGVNPRPFVTVSSRPSPGGGAIVITLRSAGVGLYHFQLFTYMCFIYPPIFGSVPPPAGFQYQVRCFVACVF